MPAAAGHDARLVYLWEDNGFASSPNDTTRKTFGADVTLSTLEGSNNAVRVFSPGSREAVEIIEQNFSGSWAVEFTLTNPWWLEAVLTSPSSSGTGPTTHTYSGETPSSMQLIQGTEATGNERLLKGCVVTSCTINASVGGNVTVSLEGAYADEEETSPGAGSLVSQVAISERPMTFAEATVERPSGTTLSLIQNASLSIENNTSLIPELGTRTAVDYSPKVRSATITYGDIVENDDELKRMYGDSAATSPESRVDNEQTIEFVFDNGETGSSKNSLTLTLTNSIANSYSRSGVGDPEADLEGTLNEMVPQISATAENSTDPAP